jgi:hypothetical protein
MPIYYFNVQDGAGGLADLDGTELLDRAAAEMHAVEVVRELLKSNETKKRPWCLDVLDGDGQPVFSLKFSTVDPSLDHLSADTRDLVERLSESRRRLAETVFWSRALVRHSRASEARAMRKPYLIARSGRRIA